MTRRSSRRGRGSALALLSLASLLGAGCGTSSTGTSTAVPATSVPASTTAGSPGSGPGDTARATTTRNTASGPATTRPATTGSTTGGAASGACGLLSVDQVSEETGVTVTKAITVDTDCVWDDESGAPVLRLEVDGGRPGGSDAATRFQTAKTLYGDDTATADLSGIGEEAFVHGLDRAVVFLKGDDVVKVWVQTDDQSRRLPASVALARKVSAEL